MTLPKVSIIIPVYNVAPYLGECLQSIENQTYQNYEAILVDDGSTDNSAQIIREFIQKKDRFVFLQKENGGVSSARNAGIAAASGQWLTFVDSDDYIEPDYLSYLVDAVVASSAELCQAGYRKYYEDSPERKGIVTRRNAHGTMQQMMGDFSFIHIRATLYASRIIKENHILFDERIVFGEDRSFNFDYFSHIQSCAVISDTSYVYRKRAGSATAKSARPEKKRHLYPHVKSFWEAFEDKAFLKAEYARNYPLAKNMLDSFLAEVMNAAIDRNDAEYQTITTDALAHMLLESFNHPEASKKEKLLVTLLKGKHPTITKTIIRCYYSDFLFRLTRPFLGNREG